METNALILDIIAMAVPIIVIFIQLIWNQHHDKKRDSELHKWEDELARLQGRLERGCEYYRRSLELLDEVASKISFATNMFIGKVDYEKLHYECHLPLDEEVISEYNKNYKTTMDELFAIRGKIAATVSNELLLEFTEYTTYLGETMEKEIKLAETENHVNTKEIKNEELSFLTKIRNEKLSLQKDLFEGRSFSVIGDSPLQKTQK